MIVCVCIPTCVLYVVHIYMPGMIVNEHVLCTRDVCIHVPVYLLIECTCVCKVLHVLHVYSDVLTVLC